MATTYVLIASNVLASATATVTFSSIPQTYTDLALQFSTRSTGSGIEENYGFQVNGLNTTIYSRTRLYGTGSAISSARQSTSSGTGLSIGSASTGDYAANTFASAELYLPNYTNSSSKPFSNFSVTERNNAAAYMFATAGLERDANPVTSISIITGNTMAIGSSFYLYGIKNS
jgi:hypothetical protein